MRHIRLLPTKTNVSGPSVGTRPAGISGGREQLFTAIEYLRDIDSSNGLVGTVGWYFGGGRSLNAPVYATVIYYGRATQPARQTQKLSGQVIGQFGTADGSIAASIVDGFAAKMDKAGKATDLTVYRYDAHHAFATPTGSRYDQADASVTWQRTLDIYPQNLTIKFGRDLGQVNKAGSPMSGTI